MQCSIFTYFLPHPQMADTRIPLTKPHFFKPLINPNFRNAIMIPISFFIKYLHGQTCEKAILRSGQGSKVWPVTINGRHIVEGWTEFVKDHDLQEGDFLVFRHEGNMVFDVIIFDPSACEREYPPFDLHHEVDDLVIEENERSKPVKHSNGTGNPSFVATLHPSYIRSKILLIPTDFSRQYLLVNGGCHEIILRDQKQRSWPVGLRFRKGKKSFYFGPGWHDFCVSNRLKEGDSFMFELIKTGNKPIMNFNWLGANSMAGRVTASEEKHRVSTPKSSFCGVIWRSNLTKCLLRIPKEFARSNDLMNKCCKMILRNKKGGGSWQVKLACQKSDGQVYIGRGWKEFAVENGLEVGDEFKIELVKGGKMLIMDYYGAN